MKITFSIGTEVGAIYVQREDGDTKAQASGFTRSLHGWGAEIHLLGMMAKKLNAMGFNLTRTTCQGDGHMYGDQWMQYLRPRKADLRKTGMDFPCLYIVDGQYAVLSSAEEYNKGEEVRFEVHGDVYGEPNDGKPSPYAQPNWWRMVKTICDEHGVECRLSEVAQASEANDADLRSVINQRTS
jgi:hypothetical protein|tara:strand:- start:76 stop:624 length:549 start_codon:yes stop_codon:yes gene_type:complete